MNKKSRKTGKDQALRNRLGRAMAMTLMLMMVMTAVFMAANFTASAASPPTVNLGTSANYAILAQSGITNTGTTNIKGNIAVSPIASTAITGFALTLDGSGQFSTSPYVTGRVYAADYANPTPATLTTAVGDMQAAYNDAAGRPADFSNLGAGTIGGLIFVPGVYNWASTVTINSDITLVGGPTDVWIFQVSGTLAESSGVNIILSGGAQVSNIFWVVSGQTTIFPGAIFNGNILDKTGIAMQSGATMNGRALAQTAVTLISNNINAPTPPTIPTVIAVTPANGATCVDKNAVVTATFSEAMDPTTINSATFIVMQGNTPVAGTVTYSGVTATFTPTAPLLSGTTYTATITTGAANLAGTHLANNFVWYFTTCPRETCPPAVITTTPTSCAKCVATNTVVTATFSEAMDPTTINSATFIVMQGNTPVAGTVTYSGVIATFTPTAPLLSGTMYTATITTGAADLSGNHLVSNYKWCFTTCAPCVVKDKVPPTVIICSPTGGACIKTTSVKLSWIASDSGSGIAKVSISTNGRTWTDMTRTNSYVWSGLTSGYHTFYVMAIDNAGNVRTTSVGFCVTTSGGHR